MSLFPYLNVNGLEVRSCSHCSLFLIPKMDLPSNITWQSWSLEMHVDPWDAWALKRLSFRADDKTFRVSNYWLMCYSNCDSGVWVYYKNSRALDSFAIYLNRMGDTRNIFTTSEFQASIFLLFLLFSIGFKWNGISFLNLSYFDSYYCPIFNFWQRSHKTPSNCCAKTRSFLYDTCMCKVIF